MPRKMRVQYPGAMYHVMSRGDQRDDIFLNEVDRLLGEHGLKQDTPVSRREFERHMERRRLEEMDPEALEAFRRDWCLGSEAFRKEQLERMEGGLGEHHAGELGLESAKPGPTALSPRNYGGLGGAWRTWSANRRTTRANWRSRCGCAGRPALPSRP